MNMISQTFAGEPEKVRQYDEQVPTRSQFSKEEKALSQNIEEALSLQEQGKQKEAIEAWRAIAKSAEGSDNNLAARAWFAIGYLFSKQGKHEEAIDAYSRSIDLNSTRAIPYNNRGAVRNELGQYEAAITDFDQVLRIDPNLAGAYSNRGNARAGMGQSKKAISDYDEALLLDPNYGEAYYNRAETKAAMGLKDEAREDLMTALNLARSSGNAALVTLVKEMLKKLDEQNDA